MRRVRPPGVISGSLRNPKSKQLKVLRLWKSVAVESMNQSMIVERLLPHVSPSHPCRLLTDDWLTDRRVEPTANPSGRHCTIATVNHWTPHWAWTGSLMFLLYHNRIIIIITMIIINIILSRCFSADGLGSITFKLTLSVCTFPEQIPWFSNTTPPNSQISVVSLFGSQGLRLRSAAHTGILCLSSWWDCSSGQRFRCFRCQMARLPRWVELMSPLWCHNPMSCS